MASQAVTSRAVPEGFEEICEGKARILVPKGNKVFYNPAQVFNRDLSVLFLDVFGKRRAEAAEARFEKAMARWESFVEKQTAGDGMDTDIGRQLAARKPKRHFTGVTVLDALSASGLRALRYLHEVESVSVATANDLSAEATAAIRRNAAHNGLAGDRLEVTEGDATGLMYGRRDVRAQWEVVDLDPYGTAAPFLDAAVQSVRSGGMLMVTCTDTATLSGRNQQACFGLYGSLPVKGAYHHEMSLRTVLNGVQQAAARYGRVIEPLFSMAVDFYVRMFIRVRDAKRDVQHLPARVGMIGQCAQCPAFATQALGQAGEHKVKPATLTGALDAACSQCGARVVMGGPLWLGPLHDAAFLDATIAELERPAAAGRFKTGKRILGVLSLAREELGADAPLYYNFSKLFGAFRLTSPSKTAVVAALRNAGFAVSPVHCESAGIKTNAPANVVFDVVRAYAKENPPKASWRQKMPYIAKVLDKPMETEVDFTVGEDFVRRQSRSKFATNPEANWGPMSRAAACPAVGVSSPAKRPRPTDEAEIGRKAAGAGAEADAAAVRGADAHAGAGAGAGAAPEGDGVEAKRKR